MKKVSWRIQKKKNVHIKWMNTCIKTRILTDCCCAGSSEEGVIEDIKRDKCVYEVDGHMHKNKSTYRLLLRR